MFHDPLSETDARTRVKRPWSTILRMLCETDLKEIMTQRAAIMQEEPYESMSGVCQKHNNDSIVTWEEIMWSDQVSHNSERYVCGKSCSAHTKYHVYSEEECCSHLALVQDLNILDQNEKKKVLFLQDEH